jgi:hypothetical protein
MILIHIAIFLMLAIAVGILYAAATLVPLLPAWFVRVALHDGDHNVAAKTSQWNEGLHQSRLRAYGDKLRGHVPPLEEIIACVVFAVTAGAGLLALLIAGNSIGIQRPAIADDVIPWLIGVALTLAIAYAFGRRREERWLAAFVLATGVLGIIAWAVIKAEASVTDPVLYAQGGHPLKDLLFAPAWIFIELAILGGAALSHVGLSAALRLVAWASGVAIELGLKTTVFALHVGALVLRLFLLGIRLVLGLVFLPAAVLWRLIRRLAGRSPDDSYRLPALPGEDPSEPGAVSSPASAPALASAANTGSAISTAKGF